MRKLSVFLFLLQISSSVFSQSNVMNDPEAAALLKASSEHYKSIGAFEADFTLTIRNPKLKADDQDAKLTEVLTGKVWLKDAKFRISLKGNEVFCNGKDIWTYIAKNKECQLNEYVESDQIFSPSKIFNLGDAGFAYQIKEKRDFKGKKAVVIEMLPGNKKVSFFKIDAAFDQQTKEVLEVKVYEKNGTHYFYNINNILAKKLSENDFVFDTKKYPGVNVVDLR